MPWTALCRRTRSTHQDESSTADLINTVNSLPALARSKVYANRLVALGASIHAELSMHRPRVRSPATPIQYQAGKMSTGAGL